MVMHESFVYRYEVDYANTDPLMQFAIDPVTGEVTVRNNLDREVEEVMTVHILAVDEGMGVTECWQDLTDRFI